MNIVKIGLVLLTGVGFGFGADKLADTETFSNDNNDYRSVEEGYYSHMGFEFCHFDEELLEHMLEDLNDEEMVLVQSKIDELLVEYSIAIEDLNHDYNIRYEFMNDLIDFLEENEIEYHNHSREYDYGDEENWHGRMGMR